MFPRVLTNESMFESSMREMSMIGMRDIQVNRLIIRNHWEAGRKESNISRWSVGANCRTMWATTDQTNFLCDKMISEDRSPKGMEKR